MICFLYLQKKHKKGPIDAELEELVRAPHSFVIHRGPVGAYCVGLTKDLRNVMEPFTATSVQVRVLTWYSVVNK